MTMIILKVMEAL